MGRPKKKAKDKFQRLTITLTPFVLKLLKKKSNKSDYVCNLILKDSNEKNNI